MATTVPVLAPYSVDGGAITGSGNVWADGSDATHIAINQSSAPLANYGRGALEAMVDGDHPYPPLTARVWLRWKANGALGSAWLFISGTDVLHVAGTPTADPVAGWARAELSETDAADFLSRWRGNNPYTFQLMTKFDTGGTVTVYEAHVLIDGPTVAPPCRNTGRDDWLGVGGARNMGTRSQQSGVRNTGYY